MATGIIASIKEASGNIKTGTIKLDETGDEVIFEKQDITCDVGDPVSFSLVIEKDKPSLATDLKCIVGEVDHVLTPLRNEYVGDVTIGENEKLVIRNGGDVKGKVEILGGKLRVAGGGNVTGNVIINKSGSLTVAGGSVNGEISGEEAELVKINNGGDVKGNVIINKGHKMVLDNGTINGGLTIKSAFKIVVKSDSKISCS